MKLLVQQWVPPLLLLVVIGIIVFDIKHSPMICILTSFHPLCAFACQIYLRYKPIFKQTMATLVIFRITNQSHKFHPMDTYWVTGLTCAVIGPDISLPPKVFITDLLSLNMISNWKSILLSIHFLDKTQELVSLLACYCYTGNEYCCCYRK